MEKTRFTELFHRFQQDALSEEELREFSAMLDNNEDSGLLQAIAGLSEAAPVSPSETGAIFSRVVNIDKPTVPLRRFSGSKIWRWAAAAVLIIGVSMAVVVSTNRHTSPSVATTNDIPAPRQSKATITLAGGQTVSLDSLSQGLLAQQGNMKLVKLANGQIAYQAASGEVMKEMQFNTLSNPRGSKVIDIQLSDGSHVWLNAGSSVTYPIAFIGKERKVSITGEAYFEVAHDKSKPFYVINGSMEVKVLGTHFNVNAYDDESDIKVTLLEGSVSIAHHAEPNDSESRKGSVILKPGQQGIIPILSSDQQLNKVHIIPNIDLDAVMAWKNGLFQFDRAPLDAVLKQLSRWYDVEVVYEKGVPDIKLWGDMKRDLTLVQVLRGLGKIGVNYKIEGKKLIVLND